MVLSMAQCIHFLLLHNKLLFTQQLKTISIYYLTVSSGQGLAQMAPLLTVLQNCNRGVTGTVLPPGGSNGEATSSTLTHVLGRIHVLAALRPRIPASSWLLARGCPQPLTTWASPARLLYFIKLAKSVSRSNLPATQSLCYVTQSQEGQCVTSTIFCYQMQVIHIGPAHPHG